MVNQFFLIGAMAFAAVLGAFGQYAMKRASEFPLVSMSQGTLWLFAFMAMYGVGALINFFAYRSGGKVSVLYPVIALSYVFSSIIAWRLLGEPMNGWIVSGSVVIVVGVAMIGVGAV